MASPGIHILIPRTCECSFYGKRDFKLRILRWEEYPRLSGSALNETKVSLQQAVIGKFDYRREGNVTTETVSSSMVISQGKQAALEAANTSIWAL